MKIDFIRHGQTPSNKAGMATGQADDSMNEEGVAQANKTLSEISNNYTEIYSSDLLRAKQTAEILNRKLNLTIQYDARLRERNFGSLTGKSWEEIGQDLRDIDKNQKYNYHPYGGESVEDVRKRLFSFIDEIVRTKQDQKILVVTHGGIIRLLHHLLNKTSETIHNASVHEFEF